MKHRFDRKAFKRGYDAPCRILCEATELIRNAVMMPSSPLIMTLTYGKAYFPDYAMKCDNWAKDYAVKNSLTYVRKYACFEGETLITYRVIFKSKLR